MTDLVVNHERAVGVVQLGKRRLLTMLLESDDADEDDDDDESM